MEIIHVASELTPCAKVGGLGDVVLGLSRELQKQDHDVSVIIPKYDCLENNDRINDLRIIKEGIKAYWDGEVYNNTLWEGDVMGLRVLFIEEHTPQNFFKRCRFYGCDDDAERFLYFSRVVVDYLMQEGTPPDILHIHDWQTGAIAPLVKDLYRSHFQNTKLVYTIHNMEHQGWCMMKNLVKTGLTEERHMTRETLQDNARFWDANLMKGGIIFSDFVTTVSPTYAREVKDPDQGRQLEKTLTLHKDKFCGVLNGLDADFWDTSKDPYLPHNYSYAFPNNKLKNKKELRKRFGLVESERPIVSFISRLVPQKGVEMVRHIIKRTLEKKGQFILLGTSPIASISTDFQKLRTQYSHNPHVHIELTHYEHLAHLIFAGADMLLVPSAFEPCGLTQLIAMKYGTVPIVRETGGLADTVFDVDHSSKHFDERNGYSFKHLDRQGISSALDRAIKHWYSYPEIWEKLVDCGMRKSYSWKLPAKKYLSIYESLIKRTARNKEIIALDEEFLEFGQENSNEEYLELAIHL